MPTFGNSNARAPKKAIAGRKPRTSSADKAAAKAGFPKGAGNGRAGSNFKPREDGRGGRSEFRAASADAPKVKDEKKKEPEVTGVKKENEGKCYFCGNDAIFLNIAKGYHKICNCSECLGKTRATGTYQFLMYKYNLTEDEAKKEQQLRADNRGQKIKEK
jgi:hypothetical protein